VGNQFVSHKEIAKEGLVAIKKRKKGKVVKEEKEIIIKLSSEDRDSLLSEYAELYGKPANINIWDKKLQERVEEKRKSQSEEETPTKEEEETPTKEEEETGDEA